MRLVAVLVVAVLCCSSAVARRVSQDREADQMSQSMKEGMREEVAANAEMVADVNAVADELRAEKAADTTGTKGFFCKTVRKSEPRNLMWITNFMNSKYGQWVPKTEKSLSVYLQAEASAAAFVGIGAGVGIGVDFTLDTTGLKATGQVHVFACLSGAISVGYMGAKASAGGGLFIGFGKNFQDGIGKSQIEIGFDIQAGPAPVMVGIGILARLGDKSKGFMEGWKSYTAKQGLPPSNKKQAFVAKSKEIMGRIVKGMGAELKAFCPNIRIVGIVLHVGAGVGTGFKQEVSVDAETLISGFKAGLKSIWTKFNFKTPKWTGQIGKTMKGWKQKAKTFFDFAPADD